MHGHCLVPSTVYCLHYLNYLHCLRAAVPAEHQLDLAAARPLLGRGGGGERAAGRPRVPPRQQRRAGAPGAGEDQSEHGIQSRDHSAHL